MRRGDAWSRGRLAATALMTAVLLGCSAYHRLEVGVITFGGEIHSTDEKIECRGFFSTEENCGITYRHGAVVSLEAVPDQNYQFGGWAGHCFGNSTPCVITMDRNRTVYAQFLEDGNPSSQEESRILTVEKRGTGNETERVFQLHDERELCEGDFTMPCDEVEYPKGTLVAIRAVVDPPFVPSRSGFLRWDGCSTYFPFPKEDCVVRMDGNRTIIANFGLVHKVDVRVRGDAFWGGTVELPRNEFDDETTCHNECWRVYKDGDDIVLIGTPNEEGVFLDRWEGCDEDTPGTRQCKITVTRPRVVTAFFSNLYPLTVEKTGNGQVLAGDARDPGGNLFEPPIDCGLDCPEQTHGFRAGTDVVIQAIPAPMYHVVWDSACTTDLPGGLPTPPVPTCFMRKENEPETITVEFRLLEVPELDLPDLPGPPPGPPVPDR